MKFAAGSSHNNGHASSVGHSAKSLNSFTMKMNWITTMKKFNTGEPRMSVVHADTIGLSVIDRIIEQRCRQGSMTCPGSRQMGIHTRAKANPRNSIMNVAAVGCLLAN